MARWAAVAGALALAVLAFEAQASVPGVVNFQGRLRDSGGAVVADGDHGMTFRIYDAEVDGTLLWSEIQDVSTVGGLFSVLLGSMTALPSDLFDGDLWLSLEVETDGEMEPRFRLASVPYALKARDAETVGGRQVGAADGDIVAVQPSGMLPALDGSQLSGVDAASVEGQSLANLDDRYVDTAGDTMTGALTLPADGLLAGVDQLVISGGKVGVGTATPSAALDVARGLRVDTSPAQTNIIGGYDGNGVTAGVVGATIFGGTSDYSGSPYANLVTDDYGTISGGAGNVAGDGAVNTTNTPFTTIGGGHENTVNYTYGTVGGGHDNTAGWCATVAGGESNTATGWGSVVAGGRENIANSQYAAVLSGSSNSAGGNNSVVCGGMFNAASGHYVGILGGYECEASGNFCFAAGTKARAAHNGTFVLTDSEYSDFASTANDQFLVRAAGGVGINTTSPGSALDVNGTVTATKFIGDGSELTGIASGTGGVTNTGTTTIGADSDSDGVGIIAFQTKNTTRMALANDGKLGIGTQTPATNLHVASAGDAAILLAADTDNVTESDNPYLKLTQDGGGVASVLGICGDAGLGPEAAAYSGTLPNATLFGNTVGTGALQLGTNSAVRMTFHSGGNVGISTTAPAEKLDVAGTVRATQLDVENAAGAFAEARVTSGAGSDARLVLDIAGQDWEIANDASNNYALSFRRNGAERLRIDADGDVYGRTVTRHYQIPASQFISWRGQNQSAFNNGNFYQMSGSSALAAPVQLPEEAQMTRFSIYYHEDEPGAYAKVSGAIYRRYPDGSTVVVCASIPQTDTTDNADIQTLTTTTIDYPSIQNDALQYYVRIFVDDWSGDPDTKIYGATIVYTLSKIHGD